MVLDVLFTGSSETADDAGMSSAITEKIEGSIYLNSFSFGVRFNNDVPITPEFSKYLFRSNFMRSEIVKTASGVTRFNISKERFKKIPVPIPCPDDPKKSLVIQAEIVRILDAFTNLTAELIVAILDKFDALANSISAGLPREIALRQKQYEYYRDVLLNFPKPDEKAA